MGMEGAGEASAGNHSVALDSLTASFPFFDVAAAAFFEGAAAAVTVVLPLAGFAEGPAVFVVGSSFAVLAFCLPEDFALLTAVAGGESNTPNKPPKNPFFVVDVTFFAMFICPSNY